MKPSELVQIIVRQLPQLEGKLTIGRILYRKSDGYAFFSFLSDAAVFENEFLVIKKAIAACFPTLRFSVRIASPGLADDFILHPESYAPIFSGIMLREHPCVAAWEYDMRWVAQDGYAALEVPDAFALEYLTRQGLQEKLNTAVYDVFRVHYPVVIRVRGDSEKRLEQIRREREEHDALLRDIAQKSAEAKPAAAKAPEKPKTRIKGGAIADKPLPIAELNDECVRATIAGRVLRVETKEISNGTMLLLIFDITDHTGSITCKAFLHYLPRTGKKDDAEEQQTVSPELRAAAHAVADQIKEGMGLLVRGKCQFDSFAKELTLMANDISRYELPVRMDRAEQKRVELHLHTKMSSMDAVASADELFARAASWGHTAIAVTDHGVVQAYPEAFAAAKKHNIKFIPGIEGYLTDEENVVSRGGAHALDEPMTALWLEATGGNAAQDTLVEVCAVILHSGQVTDSLMLRVNPERPLSKKAMENTGLTDAMLQSEPKITDALPKLMAFLDGRPLASHKAAFDFALLSNLCQRQGIPFDCPLIDTAVFAGKLYPSLKSHRIGALSKHLGVPCKNDNHTLRDANATARCLARMCADARDKGAKTLSDLNALSDGYSLANSRHIVLLATSQDGITNINHLVSEGHLNYFRRMPHMPRALITKYRQGLLVGSACEAGELFTAMVAGQSDEQLEKIAAFYDYLEIQPIGNNAFLVREGRAADDEALREYNRRIVRLGEKLGKPVIATGDVHFLDPDDAAYRAILMAGHGFTDADLQPPLYLKTTDEMLEEFAYLGEQKAREVVIDNPQKIADMVGKVRLFPEHPEGKTTFSPFWESAANDIETMTWSRAHELYGDTLPDIVQKRLEKELKSIIGYGYATLYSIANKLVTKSNADGYVVGSRGSVGSSLVATMCGITEVNALPPHYRCKRCKTADFDIPEGYTVGVDLPDKNCPLCGEPLCKEGYDIPFEVFLGFKGDKVPDIDLNFSGEYRPRANAYVEELFGAGHVFRAGTIGTLADKTAYGYVLKYMEERGREVSEAEKNRLAHGCVGVKRTTGQHPGGMVVLPMGYDICQFTAVQHPADDVDSDIVTTHYDFGSMHDVLVKLDILGHDDPTMLHMLGELTGVPYQDVPLGDKKVMSLFLSPEALGLTSDDILGCKTGTFGIPEFGTPFVRQMLDDTRPTTMEELIRISGLSHGTDVWLGNAKDLVTAGTARLKDCICTRDDIMNALIGMGVPDKMAFTTMESVRKGKGLTPEMEQAMHEHDVPAWFIDSCKKIKYMFPKGHAVAYVTMSLRVAWYKLYHPLAYYAAYFTVRGDGFDASVMAQPLARLRELLQSYYDMDKKEKTAKEESEQISVELALEMSARGFSFLPVDLYKSHPTIFRIEDGALRMPFTALNGMGLSAAEDIVRAREERPFVSVEDLKARGKVSASCIELLRAGGTLNGLPESSQVSLFQLL